MISGIDFSIFSVPGPAGIREWLTALKAHDKIILPSENYRISEVDAGKEQTELWEII